MTASTPPTLAECEREIILARLQQHGNRLAATARSLGISRTTLWRRLREYGVRLAQPEPRA